MRECRLKTIIVGFATLMACCRMLPCAGDGKQRNTPHPRQSAPAAIHVRDLDGNDRMPLASVPGRSVVLLFVTNDCPISNSYAPEIQRIQKAYGGPKFAFYLVYVDPALTRKAAKQHNHEYGYTFPALLDGAQQLAKVTGATITPEAAVVGANGKTLYCGRIDDRYVDFGKSRPQPTMRDLRNALDAITQAKPVLPATGKPIGCFLPPTK